MMQAVESYLKFLGSEIKIGEIRQKVQLSNPNILSLTSRSCTKGGKKKQNEWSLSTQDFVHAKSQAP